MHGTLVLQIPVLRRGRAYPLQASYQRSPIFRFLPCSSLERSSRLFLCSITIYHPFLLGFVRPRTSRRMRRCGASHRLSLGFKSECGKIATPGRRINLLPAHAALLPTLSVVRRNGPDRSLIRGFGQSPSADTQVRKSERLAYFSAMCGREVLNPIIIVTIARLLLHIRSR